MICDDIRAALAPGETCEMTESGARIPTHCLYPSFEPVEVFVVGKGAGYIVTDGGGAAASAFVHGRDELGKVLLRECARFGVACEGDVVVAEVPSLDWLRNAILAVANASAAAANSALERVAVAAEKALSDRIFEGLSRVVPRTSIAREFEHFGASGKRWRFDFGAIQGEGLLLVSAVAPHHVSVSAKYVAFADTPANDGRIAKLGVYGRTLDTEDVALITQVATLVPVGAVAAGARRVLTH